MAFGELHDANETSGDYEYSSGVLPTEQVGILPGLLMNLPEAKGGMWSFPGLPVLS